MIVNLKEITQAVERLFQDNLSDYIITRNAKRNQDPNIAQSRNGWVGIYRGSSSYEPATIAGGTARRWKYNVQILVEVQVASMHSGADAEDKLDDAEKEVITILSANPKLSNTVSQVMGFDVQYNYNDDYEVWFHSAIITLTAEIR